MGGGGGMGGDHGSGDRLFTHLSATKNVTLSSGSRTSRMLKLPPQLIINTYFICTAEDTSSKFKTRIEGS